MDNPIFIFSAGGRSGSTLLQRLVTSSKEVLIWGEGSGALNHILTSLKLLYISLQPGSKGGGSGEMQFKAFLDSKDESNKWVASMNPPFPHILNSYRNMFQNLYGAPAKKIGYSRWGVKEIRADISTIKMLKILFPKAKFIFLVRNPFDCLRSIKQRNFMFLDNFGNPVLNNQLSHFAKNWANLSAMYHGESQGFKLRYEDIINNKLEISSLCQYLELAQMDVSLIGGDSVDWKAPIPEVDLTDEEIQQVKPMLDKSMKLWNYL